MSDKKIIAVDFSKRSDIDHAMSVMQDQLTDAIIGAHKAGIPSSIIILALQSIIQHELNNLPQDDE